MGGGPDKETLLIILRDEEPKKITDAVRKRFPYVEVIYHKLQPLEGEVKVGFRIRSPYKPIPKELFQRTTILCTLGALPPDPKDAPNLKFIQLLSAGVDFLYKQPIYTDTDIPIATVSGIHGVPIAEWVLMTTLVATKSYNAFYEGQKKHKWDGEIAGTRNLTDWYGKTVGIAGYGSIGRQVARVFSAVGANVHAYTASPRSTEASRRDTGYFIPGTGDPDGTFPRAWYSGHSKADLHTFLRSGLDMLLISLPLTSATEGLIGAEEFDVLKQASDDRSKNDDFHDGCFLVNVSRGRILDQTALVAALNDGKLRGAALDVADPEPLPEDSPLWDAKNTVVTPHISALGREYLTRSFDVLMENLKRKEEGKELLNLVQRKRGY